ncbi:hypothetical protein Intca_1040 [Intrasporangium calvum DSM 43043]|uniref:Uncharacterized protein n=1 Tax=Intrasporangium calvum (strain ATCC 23552 / DSM 43043 / JCM 3097 / NBRC 12989 / NCIMB 10167 / NRRL B-3866 / 7 KIP) TaxID=710696 RepID=E6SDE1_INTC7|nr:hypothetical protein Intca_1040 [Intrasporangium calvum DSM 43043]
MSVPAMSLTTVSILKLTGRWSFRNFGLSVYFECV